MGCLCQSSGPSAQEQAQAQSGVNREAIFESARVNQIGQNTPFGRRYYTGDIGSPDRTEHNELSPELQRILSGQIGVTQGLTDAATNRLGQIPTDAFSLEGAPDVRRAGDVTNSTWQQEHFDQGPGLQFGFDQGPALQYGIADAGQIQRGIGDQGPIQRGVDLSGLNALPGQDDFGAERQRVEDALYGRQKRLIEPDFQQQQDSLQTQLANQGFTAGTEGYSKEMDRLGRQRESTLMNARDSAIAQAGGEQGRLFGQGLQARQQGVAEAFGTGEFGNTAQAQAYSQALGGGQFVNQAQQQQFGQNTAQQQTFNQSALADFMRNQQGAQFRNDAATTQFGLSQSAAQFANDARMNQFNQGANQFQQGLQLQNADQSNRSQYISEDVMERNQGFNELAAFLNGSPVSPSNPGYTQFDPRAQYQMAQGSPDIIGAQAGINSANAGILGSIFGAAGRVGAGFAGRR